MPTAGPKVPALSRMRTVVTHSSISRDRLLAKGCLALIRPSKYASFVPEMRAITARLVRPMTSSGIDDAARIVGNKPVIEVFRHLLRSQSDVPELEAMQVRGDFPAQLLGDLGRHGLGFGHNAPLVLRLDYRITNLVIRNATGTGATRCEWVGG